MYRREYHLIREEPHCSSSGASPNGLVWAACWVAILDADLVGTCDRINLMATFVRSGSGRDGNDRGWEAMEAGVYHLLDQISVAMMFPRRCVESVWNEQQPLATRGQALHDCLQC
jgi:hypothetical protein